MPLSFISGKKLNVLLHIVVWAVLFILPTYLVYGDSPRDRVFMMEVWLQLTCYAVIFYVSYAWLAPRFFFTAKHFVYFIYSALLIIILTIFLGVFIYHFDPFYHRGFREKIPPQDMARSYDRPKLFPPPPCDNPPPPVRYHEAVYSWLSEF